MRPSTLLALSLSPSASSSASPLRERRGFCNARLSVFQLGRRSYRIPLRVSRRRKVAMTPPSGRGCSSARVDYAVPTLEVVCTRIRGVRPGVVHFSQLSSRHGASRYLSRSALLSLSLSLSLIPAYPLGCRSISKRPRFRHRVLPRFSENRGSGMIDISSVRPRRKYPP